MMAPECLSILHAAFQTAKLRVSHNNITHAAGSFASELSEVLARKTKSKWKYHGKTIEDSYSRAFPIHIHCPYDGLWLYKRKWPLR